MLSTFERPFLTAFSDRDPITKGGEAPFRAKVPGAEGQPHTTIEGGGHFLQEDAGPELAQRHRRLHHRHRVLTLLAPGQREQDAEEPFRPLAVS